jgi:glycosyltransferase involved in cell wall biosynthesis
MTIRELRLITRLNVGGPAQHVVWLDEALTANGFQTMLVTGTVPPGEEDMSAFAAAHGVQPLVIPSMSRELSPLDLLTIWKLWRLMVRFHPHIVHTHTAKAGAVGRIAGLLYRFLSRPRDRCRFVHTYHGHVFHSYYGPLRSALFVTIERLLARLNTDRIIVLSEQQRHEIQDVFRVGRPEQFAVVPLGIDVEELSREAKAAAPARSNDMPLVGIVGRLTAIKNHDLFLRVAAQTGDVARFVVYGDGADRAHLERLAEELGVADRVHFAGTRPAAEICGLLDVIALTSLNEGTPLALIEAMTCGVPVIATAVGGVVDLLGAVVERDPAGFEMRERGIAVPSGDIAAFAAGLRRLLREEPLQRRLAESARSYVQKTHAKERLAADIIGLYHKLSEQIGP